MANEAATMNEKEKELKRASHIALLRRLLPIIGMVAVFVLFNVLTNGAMMRRLPLIVSQVYVPMMAAMGVFFIMSMGGLDFSQGSILGMASIVICYLSKDSIELALVGGVLMGAAIGAVNGYFYVNRKIQSFIVTICTMFLFRGVIKYFTTDAPINGSAMIVTYDSTAFKLAVTIAVLLIGFIAFNYTKFGIYLKAIGAGEKAARFVGIRTDRMKFLIYVLAGAITGLAAFLSVAKSGGAATYNAGSQLETQILIILVLGGMPISGGAMVRFENIIVGSFLYIILSNGLTMMGATTQMLQLVEGIVFLIFVAVFADKKSLSVIK